MEPIESKDVIDTVATEESVVQVEDNLYEVIIGVPSNTAMMKVSVLTVNEDGKAEEKTGEFNFEQILQSRAKYLQLVARASESGGDEPDGDEAGDSAGGKSAEESE